MFILLQDLWFAEFFTQSGLLPNHELVCRNSSHVTRKYWLNIFYFSLSVTIMSRLMLHLHKIGTEGIYADHAKTIGPISRDQEEYGSMFISRSQFRLFILLAVVTFTTLWSNSDPSATDSFGVGDLSAFEQGSSSGLQTRSWPHNYIYPSRWTSHSLRTLLIQYCWFRCFIRMLNAGT